MSMIILGIETSCDETSVALVRDDKTVLAHEILSQRDHDAYGGVVPEIAARAHLTHLKKLTDNVFATAKIAPADIDGVAATIGPGLIGGLLVGATFAKGLAMSLQKPFLGINHLEGHALTPRLAGEVPFPFLLLLVSGGHCQILACAGVGDYKRYGATIDDAIGEAFDKTAKLMGLGYPGGPAIEKLALECADIPRALNDFPLPRPFVGRKDCDFSLSGLKTAVRRLIEGLPAGDIARADAAAIAASFQNAIGDIIIDRLTYAVDLFRADHPQAKTPALVMAGGVAANKYLRGRIDDFALKNRFVFNAPPLNLCSDNAAMIAWAGIERLKLGLVDDLGVRARPRWPLDGMQGKD